jgi:ankyrin repeat protein
MFGRAELARSLIAKKADLEAKCAKGNTPFLLASGAGVTDIIQALIDARADVHAKNNKGCGAMQKAMGSSGSTRQTLREAQVQQPVWEQWADSGRTRTGVSDARQVRQARDDRRKRR